MAQIKILAGLYKGRNIKFDDQVLNLRPTLSRIKETLFNWLGQYINNYRVLDLFAGSGSLGFEALSRGAKLVIMLDNNKQVINHLNANKKNLAISNQNLITIHTDAIIYINELLQQQNNIQLQDFDLFFLDPPYEQYNLIIELLNIIRNIKRNKPICIYFETKKIFTTKIIECAQSLDYIIIKEKNTRTLSYILLKLPLAS